MMPTIDRVEAAIRDLRAAGFSATYGMGQIDVPLRPVIDEAGAVSFRGDDPQLHKRVTALIVRAAGAKRPSLAEENRELRAELARMDALFREALSLLDTEHVERLNAKRGNNG